jgi:transketolase
MAARSGRLQDHHRLWRPEQAGQLGRAWLALGAEEIAAARAALGWDHAEFIIPEDILADWRAIGRAGRATREAWNARVDAAAEPRRIRPPHLGRGQRQAGPGHRRAEGTGAGGKPKVATRKASEMVLEVVNPLNCPKPWAARPT